MWTSQVYGHHDKMARTKTHRTSQTRSIQRRNIHKEITIFFLVYKLNYEMSKSKKHVFTQNMSFNLKFNLNRSHIIITTCN